MWGETDRQMWYGIDAWNSQAFTPYIMNTFLTYYFGKDAGRNVCVFSFRNDS